LTVTLRARKTPPESVLEFDILRSIETDQRHARRQDTIRSRESIKHLDPDVYITVPTPIAAQIGIVAPQGETIAPISKGTIIDADGKEHEIVIVPSGKGVVGFTSKAAQLLRIPDELQRFKLRADKGKFVIA